ncbi:MAG: acyl-CoA reductase, partial [Sphingobacteriaceae bacterium]
MTDKISLQKRLDAFAQLGAFLKNGNEQLDGLIASAQHYNGWFTPENTQKAVAAIADMLDKEALQTWAAQWQ